MIFKRRKKIREIEGQLIIKAADLQAAVEDLQAAIRVLAGKIQQHDLDLAGLGQVLDGTRDKLSFVLQRGLGIVMLPPAVVPPMGPPAAGIATLDSVKTEE